MKLASQKGFSLVELIVSFGIFGILSTAIASILYVGNISWAMQDANVRAQTYMRATITQMSRDLRVGTGLNIVQEVVAGEDVVNITFARGGVAMAYDWTTAAGDDQNRLIRTVDGAPIVLAHNITALSLTETPDDIKINVTTSVEARGKDMDYTLEGNVAKR